MAESDSNRLQYEQWVRLFAPELYRYAYRLTGNHQLAEDLLQETFVEAWRSITKQKVPEKPRGWFFQILRYRHAHYLRDNRRERQMAALSDNQDSYPADRTTPALHRLAEQDALQTALSTLSPIIRQTFLMVFSEGLTCREVAQSLQIPIGTVLSRLDSGRRALRAILAGDSHRPESSNSAGSKSSVV
jgi:RNA polymerase sigma-70 factor, ECF subfamily